MRKMARPACSVVAAGEPVPVQHVQDVGEQVQAYPVVAHAPFLLRW